MKGRVREQGRSGRDGEGWGGREKWKGCEGMGMQEEVEGAGRNGEARRSGRARREVGRSGTKGKLRGERQSEVEGSKRDGKSGT